MRSDGYARFNKAARITMFQPHMHMLGTYQCIEFIYPTQPVRAETVNCAGFDYNWHMNYNYDDSTAPLIPAGTILHVSSWLDNSAANRAMLIQTTGSERVSAPSMRWPLRGLAGMI